MLSQRIQVLQPSPTLAITAKAKAMQEKGINIIGFGAGEPDFDTPETIKNAAKKALDSGFTKYTPTAGIPKLKEAIAAKLKRDNGLDYSAGEILVSCGAKHSLFNAVMALCDPGDEVIIPAPYWVSYIEMVNLTGGKAIILPTSQQTQFKITPQQLEKAITPKTKLFIFNSPSNPTGMIYSKKEMEALAQILADKNIVTLSDEIYEKLIYGEETHCSWASLNEKIKAKTLVINGVSKSYSMTGWRIGYAAGPKTIIQAMSNLQDHSTSNPTSIAQYGAAEALNGNETELQKMKIEFKKRRDYMVQRVNGIAGLSLTEPQGAFYAFVNVQRLLSEKFNGQPIATSMQLTEILLEHAQVAVVPGSAFGAENFIRLSYATSMENIQQGLDRIETFAKKILHQEAVK